MIDAKQIRAARALLGWSQTELAKATGLAHSSIKNIESEATSYRKASMSLIADALDDAGVEFLPGSGLRLRSHLLAVFTGRTATARLLDTLYEAAHSAPEREVCILGLDEEYSKSLDGHGLLQDHIDRLQAAGIGERILVCEGDRAFLNAPESYRWMPRAYFCKSAPIYIAGSKVAIHFGSLNRTAIVIEIRSLAHHLRSIFNFVWDHARVPDNQATSATAPQQASNASQPCLRLARS